nr:hypothetical protein [Lachnospiraceae bacterium]
YTVSVKNNKNAYELENASSPTQMDKKKAPRVEITFKGSYKGRKIVYFSILKQDISQDGFEAPEITLTYTGKALKVKPAVYQNGVLLKQNKDYSMSAVSCKEPGTYEATLIGIGNYKGTRKLSITVTDDVKQVAMEDVKVSGVKNVSYSGTAIEPTGFIVKYGKATLTEGTDYTVSYGENINAGTGTIILTGTETANSDGLSFHGIKRVSFKITGMPISKAFISGFFAALPYTGEQATQTLKLTYTGHGDLKEGRDYAAPVYTNNVNAGTASVSIKGIGGFTGTLKRSFKITPVDIGLATITVGDAMYTKGGAKPEVTISFGGRALVKDKDYSISYRYNSKPTNAALVILKGKGNYQGTKDQLFKVFAKSLTAENGLKLVAADKAATGKKNGWSQSFKVYDTDGKALVAKKDYDNASYSIVSGELNGESVSAETALTKDDIVGAGSVIRISVDGKGDYAGGTLTGTYRILEAGYDISKATFKVNDQVYPGKGGSVSITSASQFKSAGIKQGSGTTPLVFETDFEVVEGSYVNNTKTGTAKVTFRGLGRYGGTKTVSFKITAKIASD